MTQIRQCFSKGNAVFVSFAQFVSFGSSLSVAAPDPRPGRGSDRDHHRNDDLPRLRRVRARTFCSSCGYPVAGAQCASCGGSLVAGARFCHCGSSTSSAGRAHSSSSALLLGGRRRRVHRLLALVLAQRRIERRWRSRRRRWEVRRRSCAGPISPPCRRASARPSLQPRDVISRARRLRQPPVLRRHGIRAFQMLPSLDDARATTWGASRSARQRHTGEGTVRYDSPGVSDASPRPRPRRPRGTPNEQNGRGRGCDRRLVAAEAAERRKSLPGTTSALPTSTRHSAPRVRHRKRSRGIPRCPPRPPPSSWQESPGASGAAGCSGRQPHRRSR